MNGIFKKDSEQEWEELRKKTYDLIDKIFDVKKEEKLELTIKQIEEAIVASFPELMERDRREISFVYPNFRKIGKLLGFRDQA